MSDWNHIPWVSYGRRESPAELAQKCQEQRDRLDSLVYQPSFSILINATHLKSIVDLERSLEFLTAQTYPHWTAEVWLPTGWAMNVQPRPGITLRESGVLCLGEMLDQSRRLARNPPSADGWNLVFHGGDVLSPAALFQFVAEMNAHPGAEVLYPQECVADVSGKKSQVTLLSKCRDSLVTLLHFNYIGRCFAFHERLAARMQWPSSQEGTLAGLGEHAWLLRARACTLEFRLVPGYWYYRNQVSMEPLFESDFDATTQMVHAASWPVSVERGTKKSTRIVPTVLGSRHRLSVVICFRDKAALTYEALASVLDCRTRLPLEIVLMDNGSSDSERQYLQAKLKERGETAGVSLTIVPFFEPFNFGRMNNVAVEEHCTGDVVLFLNNDVVLDPSVDLDAWAAWTFLPEVGTVGICLKFPDGRVQHCGIRASFGGRSHLLRVGNSHRQDALTELGREVFANTFAACMVRRDTFLEAGGLDTLTMANGFGDVALNLRLRKSGLKNVYLGYFHGTHAESSSRGQSYEYWEEVELERTYSDVLYAMVREDLTCSLLPIAEVDVAAWLADTLKAQVRSMKWLNPVKPALKRMVHRVWPSQANLPI